MTLNPTESVWLAFLTGIMVGIFLPLLATKLGQRLDRRHRGAMGQISQSHLATIQTENAKENHGHG